MIEFKNELKAKVVNVTPLAIKQGQKDLVDVPSVRIEATVANTFLNQLDPTGKLREVMFEPAGTNSEHQKKKQKELDGVEPVSDRPILTRVGQMMGTQTWGEEQTGSKLTFVIGTARSKSNIVLAGATLKKLQFTGIEPGAVKIAFTVNGAAADAQDDNTYGRLFKLKKREVTILLDAPQVDQAGFADADEEEGTTLTPLQALERGAPALMN